MLAAFGGWLLFHVCALSFFFVSGLLLPAPQKTENRKPKTEGLPSVRSPCISVSIRA